MLAINIHLSPKISTYDYFNTSNVSNQQLKGECEDVL